MSELEQGLPPHPLPASDQEARSSTKVHVVLADDHELVRCGIKYLLQALHGVQVIAEAQDGEELLRVLGLVRPDIVLVDITMPRMDGLRAIARIRQIHPHLRVLVLSMHDSTDLVRRAIAAGACGFISKDATEYELDLALRTAMRKGSYFSPSITQRLLQPPEPTASDQLTERQLEILVLLAQGKGSKEIGFELGLSARTVDVHRSRIMQRLQLHDLASLTRYAVRKGLIQA